MLTRPFSLKPLCLAALLCAAGAAQADITVYRSESAFLAAVSAPGVDSFDDLSAATPYADTLYRTAGAYTYQAYSTGGLWGAGGGGDQWLSNTFQTAPIVFSGFSPGVTAFGGRFFATDVFGDYLPAGNLMLTAVDGTALTYSLEGAATDSFLGFVSDSALYTVVLGANGGEEYWPTANDVVLAVPEPTTYGMLLAGVGVLGLAARRRQAPAARAAA